MTTTYTVTFGRNVGLEPMGEDVWNDFQAGVYATIAEVVQGPGVVFQGTAEGTWEDAQFGTIHEESCCLVAVGTIDDLDLFHVRAMLSFLAVAYGQQAIGLAVAPTELLPS